MSRQMKLAVKTVIFMFAFFLLVHWLTAGTDEIIEGPPETPDHSFVRP